MGGGVVKEVESKAAPVVVHFWASWCEASKQMDQVFAHLATDFPHALFPREGCFGSFVALCDDEVRQGLKVFSNWSSYPQLHIRGELIGGSDIMLEMQKSGELKKILTEKGIVAMVTLEDRLKTLITSSPVMLFMKGTPDAARCGFSSKVVNVLQKEGIGVGSFDILTDEEVRQGLKTYSNWPTFPQLYYEGELIGWGVILCWNCTSAGSSSPRFLSRSYGHQC